jgi:hypothetical protein
MEASSTEAMGPVEGEAATGVGTATRVVGADVDSAGASAVIA